MLIVLDSFATAGGQYQVRLSALRVYGAARSGDLQPCALVILAREILPADCPHQWVAETAPASVQKVLAYITGWLVTLSWITFLASCATIIGNLAKYCILVYRPLNKAANSQWLPTLLALSFLVVAALVNIYLAKQLPRLEGAMLCMHLATFVAFIATLWSTSPIGSAREVIFTFTNPAGWPNAGVASMIGVLTPWSSVIGYDSSVHMSMSGSLGRSALAIGQN